MRSTLSKLFSSRKASKPSPRRLGVEELGERIVPAAINGTIAGTRDSFEFGDGNLRLNETVNGGAMAFQMNGQTPQVQVTEKGVTSSWYSIPLPSGSTVTEVQFGIGGGQQSFTNLSSLSSQLLGVAQYSNDTLQVNTISTLETVEIPTQSAPLLFLSNDGGIVYQPGPSVTSLICDHNAPVSVTAGSLYQLNNGIRQTLNLGLEGSTAATALASSFIFHDMPRQQVLNLFSYMETHESTITQADMHDLQAIFNGSTISMTAAVQNLADKIVDGDPANVATLQAGSSTSVLTTLVGQWFEGDVLPQADGNTYVNISAPLFGSSGPQYTDVDQGSTGDCYLLAALGEMAQDNPQAIKNMFINNGDGTYTVRFYVYNSTETALVPDYVTVNTELPVYYQGGEYYTFAYANEANNYGGGQTFISTTAPTSSTVWTSNEPMWVALAEKAYTQIRQELYIASGYPGPASYDSLWGGDPGMAVAQITGYSDSFIEWGSNCGTTNAENFLQAEVEAGSYVSLSTWNNPGGGMPGSHAYAVVGYNSSTGIYTVLNPWGTTYSLTGAQIVADFDGGIEAVEIPNSARDQFDNSIANQLANNIWFNDLSSGSYCPPGYLQWFSSYPVGSAAPSLSPSAHVGSMNEFSVPTGSQGGQTFGGLASMTSSTWAHDAALEALFASLEESEMGSHPGSHGTSAFSVL